MDPYPRVSDYARGLFTVGVFLAVGVAAFFLTRHTQSSHVRLRIGDREMEVRLADTVAERRRGLSGTSASAPERDRAMFFVFPEAAVQQFWMHEMRYPLDVVWVYQGVIVGFDKNVPSPVEPQAEPARMGSEVPADAVLELPAGYVDAFGLRAGDTITGVK